MTVIEQKHDFILDLASDLVYSNKLKTVNRNQCSLTISVTIFEEKFSYPVSFWYFLL